MPVSDKKQQSGDEPQVIKTLFLTGSLYKLRSSALITVLAAGAYAVYLLLSKWGDIFGTVGEHIFN